MDTNRINPEAPISEEQVSKGRAERKRVEKIIEEIMQEFPQFQNLNIQIKRAHHNEWKKDLLLKITVKFQKIKNKEKKLEFFREKM